MSDAPSTAKRDTTCPECGAWLKPGATECWLCLRKGAVTADVVEPPPIAGSPFAPKWVPKPTSGVPFQFSLESLMLVVTLVAVCLGVTMAAPGFGILLCIIAAPALIRTLMAGYQERAAGHKMSIGEKVLTFLASTGITMAVLGAGGSAFAAACMATCFAALGISEATRGSGGVPLVGEQILFPAALIISSIVGLGTAIWIFWLLRPRRQ
jgi:hypothetical protein